MSCWRVEDRDSGSSGQCCAHLPTLLPQVLPWVRKMRCSFRSINLTQTSHVKSPETWGLGNGSQGLLVGSLTELCPPGPALKDCMGSLRCQGWKGPQRYLAHYSTERDRKELGQGHSDGVKTQAPFLHSPFSLTDQEGRSHKVFMSQEG